MKRTQTITSTDKELDRSRPHASATSSFPSGTDLNIFHSSPIWGKPFKTVLTSPCLPPFSRIGCCLSRQLGRGRALLCAGGGVYLLWGRTGSERGGRAGAALWPKVGPLSILGAFISVLFLVVFVFVVCKSTRWELYLKENRSLMGKFNQRQPTSASPAMKSMLRRALPSLLKFTL